MSGTHNPPEPTPPPDKPCEHKPTPTPPANDCECPEGGLLGKINLDDLLGGSVTVGPWLAHIDLDGEPSANGALLSVVAGGEGLGDISVHLNTNALGDLGGLGDTSGLLGCIDILDGLVCDNVLI